MNLVKLLIITLSTFLWGSSLYAQMYQWTDESGVKHYSNVSPSESVEEINIDEEHSGEKRTKTDDRRTRKVNKSTRKTQEKASLSPGTVAKEAFTELPDSDFHGRKQAS